MDSSSAGVSPDSAAGICLGRNPRAKVADYLELTKPRITLMVVLTAAAGYVLGSGRAVDYLGLAHMAVGVMLLSSGISALNQWIERQTDGLMVRTRMRPLPAGRLASSHAFVFGIALSAVATGYLWFFINPLSAVLGVVTFASYVCLYTPLKTKTTLATMIGAFPGAMPPLIGWVAATGRLSLEAVILFSILFLWQFPHFLAIAWMYREDYGRAGIKMLPVVEPDGRTTSLQIVAYTLALLPVSLLPALVHLSGTVYLIGAALLGVGFLYYGVRTAVNRTTWQARQLLLASVVYLPALFMLMVLNR